MLLISTQNIAVKLRYYFNNNGQHYFQRHVPKSLRRFYGNKTVIRHKLPSIHSQMLLEVNRLARHYDKQFKDLKSGSGGTPSQMQAQAIALLATYGVLPGEGVLPAQVPHGYYAYPHLSDIDHYLTVKKQAGTMTQVDTLAEQLLIQAAPVLLSQAPEIYFESHGKGATEKFRRGVLKRWKNIYGVTGGDIPLSEVTRDMARRYIGYRSSVRTATIERELKTIRAIINAVIREKSLSFKNQFERLRIPNKGRDSVVRKPFSLDEYRTLIKACLAKGDEIRTLILLTCLTGARPSEIAGLRREDLHLTDPHPHFDIVEYGNRTLKTKNSIRKTPLIPIAVKAIDGLLGTHQEAVLFPRYCDGDQVFGDNVSAATGRYIQSLGIEKKLYSARHTVKTLLDQAGIPEYLSEAIGGWGKASISRGYGSGHSIAAKYAALEKSLAKVL